MIVKLLIEHHLQLLSLKGGCRGSSESTFVTMSNCWKSHALAQILNGQSFKTHLSTSQGNVFLQKSENQKIDTPGSPAA